MSFIYCSVFCKIYCPFLSWTGWIDTQRPEQHKMNKYKKINSVIDIKNLNEKRNVNDLKVYFSFFKLPKENWGRVFSKPYQV